MQSAAKSLLVLTAPKVIEDINDIEETKLKTEDQNQIDLKSIEDPELLIEQLTKQIRLDVENEILDELIEESKQITQAVSYTHMTLPTKVTV